jgi:hypothetical protein
LFLSQLPGACIFQCREAKQYCHSYYDAYRGGAVVQQGVAQLPSGNTARLNGKALAELMCARRSSRRARMKLTNLLTSFRSETQIGNRRLHFVASTYVVEAGKLCGAARCEYGLLDRATG